MKEDLDFVMMFFHSFRINFTLKGNKNKNHFIPKNTRRVAEEIYQWKKFYSFLFEVTTF